MPRARFAEILRLLAAHDVEFVVVGMTAGILQGAPVSTVDLDVVHRRSPENVATAIRLASLLGTSPELWLNLQTTWDLWQAYRSERRRGAA